MTYFQGGDFVELLSAQGPSPAAAWRLHGRISKTFDKSIKGNAFQLDGGSETKLQLPKRTSSALGLAQRFVVLQVFVPLTRSFCIEICASDCQKVRRRFILASAFRDTTRTALHVQLPLSATKLRRDQWQNLVIDLATLSGIYFAETSYRAMESICVGGSCRLKRIFTMKEAPTPSNSIGGKPAETRDIPRQFVFTAAQGTAIPTLYFSMEPLEGGDVHGVTLTTRKSAASHGATSLKRRTRTAPVKTQSKSLSAGTRAKREGVEHKTQLEMAVDRPMDSRLVKGNDKLRRVKSQFDKVVIAKASHEQDPVALGLDVALVTRRRAFEADQDVAQIRSGSALKDDKEEGERLTITSPERDVVSTEHSSKPTIPSQSPSLRESILGEIQQKLASLEDEEKLADERDRELFLRHTSLRSSDWQLQQLYEEDVARILLSDDEESDLQLSSLCRREGNDESIASALSSSSDVKQRPRCDVVAPVDTSSTSSCLDAKQGSIFSFSSFVEQRAASNEGESSRLFNFDSLLQDVKPWTSLLDGETNASCLKPMDNALVDSESDSDDQELLKMLAAKRSARQKLLRNEAHEDDHEATKRVNECRRSLLLTDDAMEKQATNDKLQDDVQDLTRLCGKNSVASDRDDWIGIENDAADDEQDATPSNGLHGMEQDEESCQQAQQDAHCLVELGNDLNDLSIDLTSELSASEDSRAENSIESDHVDLPLDEDSSFDFDLVQDVASSSDCNDDSNHALEDASCHQVPTSATPSPVKSNSPRRHDLIYGHQDTPPRLPTKTSSPSTHCSLTTGKLVKSLRSEAPVHPIDLSSSFSSSRLQKLLESTDWTAELNAHASSLDKSLQRHNNLAHLASSTDIRPPKTSDSTRRSSRFETPSTSSIELVYDPLLHCYYDPVAKKYYALAK